MTPGSLDFQWKKLRLDSLYASAAGVALVIFFFLAFTLPLAFERVAGGRSSDGQAYVAGTIRLYCQEPTHSIFKSPKIHWGKESFNLEFTGFEWAEGVAAREIGGPDCDLIVEEVGKLFSIACSALAILVLALVAAELWGGLAGLLGAVLLGTDELWLRYATYTMIPNRVLLCALLGFLFSLRRRPLAAGLFWALAMVQKPQMFLFIAAMWGITELVRAKSVRRLFLDRRFQRTCAGVAGAVVVGFVWFGWSERFNSERDLPWIIHTGSRMTKWYFGDWGERLTLKWARNTLLSWLKESGLNVGVPLVALLAAVRLTAEQARDAARQLFKIGLPLLVGFFLYSFIFWHVFIIHEYYALPMNVARALTSAGVFALLVELGRKARVSRKPALKGLAIVPALVVALAVGRYAFIGLRDYSRFALNINNPAAPFYQPDWNYPVFPKKYGFSVVAAPGTGRDLLFLYLAQQHGFVWCSHNPRFAPRAFWKSQGIEYVGWTTGSDPVTHRMIWTIRTMDEELAYARARGWSSDVNDVWAAHSMAEWAHIASRLGKDPCIHPEDFDPRDWEK